MRILYIATSAYPGDSAYSTRIYGICKALQLSGNETDVLTDYSNNGIGTLRYANSNVTVCAKHVYADRSIIDKILAPVRMKMKLRSMLIHNRYDCIILSSIYMRIQPIMSIIHQFHIPIILESCEWFEAYNWKREEKSFEYKRFVRAWNHDFTKADGVIAISRMLHKHYSEYTNHVLRVPTIMDIPSEYQNQSSGEPIKIVFTGSIAWGKDRLIEVIHAFDELRNDDVNLELHIYGPSRDAILNQLNYDDGILSRNSNIFVHGRIPHKEISGKCSECDFGIILRPDRKQSNAGFPTKIAEYFAVGTSVIANDTGDLELYVNNGVNGFLLPRDFTTEQLKDIIRGICKMSKETLNNIKQNAYSTALEFFNCPNYSQILHDFVMDVVNDYSKD